MDGDGDTDVVLSERFYVTWYENTDGAGTFGTEHVISQEANEVRSVDPGNSTSARTVDSTWWRWMWPRAA